MPQEEVVPTTSKIENIENNKENESKS